MHLKNNEDEKTIMKDKYDEARHQLVLAEV